MKGSQQIESYAAGANDVMNLINAQYFAVQAAAADDPDPASLLKLAKEIVKADAIATKRRAEPKTTDAVLQQTGAAAVDTWVQTLPGEAAELKERQSRTT